MQASELVVVSKALTSAVSNVAAMSQSTSPKMMVASAKLAVSAISSFPSLTNATTSNCPDPETAKVSPDHFIQSHINSFGLTRTSEIGNGSTAVG